MDSTTSTTPTSSDSPSSSSSSNNESSSRLVTALRKLAVDLKMDLAEALAKVDDLTLANKRLARERDEARAEVRRLRRSQYMYQHHIRSHSDRDVQRRRASDGGAPSLCTIGEGRPSSLRNILSGLHDEVVPTDHAHGDDIHASASSLPPIADRTSSDNAFYDHQDADSHASTSSSKLFDELQRRYDEISLDGDKKNPGRNVSETDKAAGLPQIRHKVSKLSTSARNAASQHQAGDCSPIPKEDEEVCIESYHEYTAKTKFNGSSKRSKDQGHLKKRLLVSELQIAQARITFGDESRK